MADLRLKPHVQALARQLLALKRFCLLPDVILALLVWRERMDAMDAMDANTACRAVQGASAQAHCPNPRRRPPH